MRTRETSSNCEFKTLFATEQLVLLILKLHSLAYPSENLTLNGPGRAHTGVRLSQDGQQKSGFLPQAVPASSTWSWKPAGSVPNPQPRPQSPGGTLTNIRLLLRGESQFSPKRGVRGDPRRRRQAAPASVPGMLLQGAQFLPPHSHPASDAPGTGRARGRVRRTPCAPGSKLQRPLDP